MDDRTEFGKINNPYEIIMRKYESIIEKNNLLVSEIKWMKDISYNIEKYNLYSFHTEFLSLLLSNPSYSYFKKISLIQLFSELEYKYQISYRKLIHIESMFFQVYYLLTSDKEIDSNEIE